MKPFEAFEENLKAFDPQKVAESAKRTSGFSGDEGSGHIFYDLIEFLGDRTQASRTTLYYYFHSYQECFLKARSGGLQLAAEKRKVIETALPLNFDPQTNLALEVVWCPARAFLELAEKRFPEAEASLKRSIEGFREFENLGLPQAAGARLEQQLNLCRIHLKINDTDRAIASSALLMTEVAAHIQHEADALSTLAYYFDSLLWSSFRLDPADFHLFISEILHAATDIAAGHGQVPLYLELLAGIREATAQDFLSRLNDHFEAFFLFPRASQTALLAHVAVLAAVHSAPNRFSIGDQVAGYLKNRLKVDIPVLKSVMTAMFSQQRATLTN